MGRLGGSALKKERSETLIKHAAFLTTMCINLLPRRLLEFRERHQAVYSAQFTGSKGAFSDNMYSQMTLSRFLGAGCKSRSLI